MYENVAPREIRNDVIEEVDGNGAVLWRWSTAEHYSQLPLNEDERNIIYREKTADVFHTNSVQELPENKYEADNPAFRKGNILVSQRNNSIVFIIDKATGDIVWVCAERLWASTM